MASRRLKLLSFAAVATVGAAGYFLYSVFAVQGQGVLSQTPLNVQSSVPPAFVMAVDDSNSMTFERIFPGGDGRMRWNSSNASFFNNDGSFYSIGNGCNNGHDDCYLYLFPHSGYNASYGPGDAIPPLDAFGFARSHVYNAGYFNPGIVYKPWLDVTDLELWPDADPAATRADPRVPGTYGDSFATAYNVVYNLNENRRVTSETFSLLDGMRIPNLSGRDMRYRWGGDWSTSARNINSNTDIAFDYFPATFYLPVDADVPDGYRTADVNRPIVEDACGPGCDLRRYEIKPGNYQTTAAYDAAIKNFANWFQYHRNRLLSMVGAMSYAMEDIENIRMGYFTINDRVNVTMRDVATERGQLYQSFYRLQAGGLVGKGGGTPNRDAVAHLGEQFRRTGDNAPIIHACQRNGGMLFTDGFTNSGTGPTDIGNVDGGMGQAPFVDNFGNTIADIAARYYLGEDEGGLAPLRTGGAFPRGLVKPQSACGTDDETLRMDCQEDLHMNFYGVTLGARGAIYDVNAAATADPFTTHPNWNAVGNPRDSDGAPTVDEIWHGTINSRGKFVNAKTPADIAAAMRSVIGSVTVPPAPSGSISLTGSRIGTGSLSVEPSYAVENEGTDWYGRLTAYALSVGDDRTVEPEEVWEASSSLPTHGSRDIWFGDDTGARRFLATNLSLEALCAPGNALRVCDAATDFGDGAGQLDVSIEEAVDYLRGSRDDEVRGDDGKLRRRTTLLGDIVNSTPVVSAPTDDYGYRTLSNTTLAASYQDYLDDKRSDHKVMVYVGANDGMLHAFDGGMGVNGELDLQAGEERFAYIPQAVIGHLGNLLFPYVPTDGGDQKFQHRYYVDGPITVSDAHYDGGWKTVLVGTAGAGGRSVFALDVTDTSQRNEFSGSDRLWELNSTNEALDEEVRENIGHVLGRPVVVPVKTASGDGSWKAIFGNGYNSESGKAVLFIVDIDDDGTPGVRMIEAIENPDEAPAGASNGLGNIAVLDRWSGTDQTLRARDGFADTVYAADQKGAIWKFDLRDSADSIDEPLFVTKEHEEDGENYRQPILGGLTAAAGPGGGVMLFFGTGSFSFVNDPSDASVQSLYGILDRGDGERIELGQLVQQSIVTTTTDGGRTARTTTSLRMTPGARGWYIDLPEGERAVGYPRIESGVIFIPTYAPNDTVGCTTVGLNWLFGQDALSGAAGLSNVRYDSPTGDSPAEGTGALALETEGTAPVKDVEVMSMARVSPLAAGADPDDLAEALDTQCSMVIQVAGAPALYMPRACGRQSWRQIQ